MTATEAILNEERHLLRQAQGDLVRQVGSLAEVDEVLEGESEGDGFGEGDGDVLCGVLDVGVLTDGDGATANVTLAGELDTLLRGLNDDWERN